MPAENLSSASGSTSRVKTKTHYDVLSVARDAPQEVVRAAYKALSQKWHPDKNPSAEAAEVMRAINVAYAVLSDATARTLNTTARSRRPMQHGLRTRRTGNQHAHIRPELSRHPTPPRVNQSRSRDGRLRSIGMLSSVRRRDRNGNTACSAKTACLLSVRPWASWSLSCMSRISLPLRTGNPRHIRNRGVAMQRSRNRLSASV